MIFTKSATSLKAFSQSPSFRISTDVPSTSAIKKYQDSIKEAPDDATPVRNLSAAYFEAGQCISAAQKVLDMIPEQGKNTVILLQAQSLKQVNTLKERLAKAKIHDVLHNQDWSQAMSKILHGLPRHRPSM